MITPLQHPQKYIKPLFLEFSELQEGKVTRALIYPYGKSFAGSTFYTPPLDSGVVTLNRLYITLSEDCPRSELIFYIDMVQKAHIDTSMWRRFSDNASKIVRETIDKVETGSSLGFLGVRQTHTIETVETKTVEIDYPMQELTIYPSDTLCVDICPLEKPKTKDTIITLLFKYGR